MGYEIVKVQTIICWPIECSRSSRPRQKFLNLSPLYTHNDSNLCFFPCPYRWTLSFYPFHRYLVWRSYKGIEAIGPIYTLRLRNNDFWYQGLHKKCKYNILCFSILLKFRLTFSLSFVWNKLRTKYYFFLTRMESRRPLSITQSKVSSSNIFFMSLTSAYWSKWYKTYMTKFIHIPLFYTLFAYHRQQFQRSRCYKYSCILLYTFPRWGLSCRRQH